MTRLAPLIRVVCLTLALITGSATAQTANTASDPATGPDPAEPGVAVVPVRADEDIAGRISGILDATGWFDDIAVEAREGVVFLDGAATTEAHRDWARSLALRTEGVAAVVNRLTVVPRVSWSFGPALAEIRRMLIGTVAALPLIAFAAAVLVLAWLAARLVSALARRLFARRIRSRLLRDVAARAVALPVLLAGLYLVLQVAGLTQLALSLVGGAGVLGIVAGFAFRDIAENFLASLLLGIRQPFRRGDLVQIDDHRGFVHSMNTRSTVLVTEDGNHIQIPNAVVYKTVILNMTAAPSRRGDLSVGVGYDASVAEVQTLMARVMSDHPAVAADPAPMALVDGLGAATVNMKGYFWFDGREVSAIRLRSTLLRRMKAAMTEAGISMPDEAREVIFPQGVPVLGHDGAAPPPPPPVAAEPEASDAERDLSSEARTLDRQMRTDVEASGEDDLLQG